MVKKTITYKAFNGEEVTEDLYFHLSKPQLLEIELEFQPDGLAVAFQKMQDEGDGKAIFQTFKKLILQSYGKLSSDGKRHIRNSLISEEFESSKAWETIFDEFIENPEMMNDFIVGIVPGDVSSQVVQALNAEPKPEPQTMTWAQAREYSDGQELTRKIVAGEIVIVDS